jgi:GDSL-like Lipase/Acylhydrolase family
MPDPGYPNPLSRQFNRYVAPGYSYSAGPGYGRAGDPILTAPGPNPPYTQNCSQNDQSWPMQLKSIINPQEFQFSACSGYNTSDIRNVEILDPDSRFGDPDLVTITLGGNNNDSFVQVVTQCPFGWPWDHQSCTDALDNAQKTVAGIDQEVNDTLTAAATHNRAPGNSRVVVAMGYPQLYNNDTWAADCRVSPARRASVNQLVVAINAKYKAWWMR